MPPAYLRGPAVATPQRQATGCNGKRGFPSVMDAKAMFARLPALKEAYHCKSCGLWHVTREKRKTS